jgi:hypothetical protein
MRTKKKVDFNRLSAALTDYPFGYLITVDEDYRVHTVTVEPTLRELPQGPEGPEGTAGPGAILDVGLIGGRTRNNLAHRSDVTLLWPPPEPGGYSLIVDGYAATPRSPMTQRKPRGVAWCPPAPYCTARPTPRRRPRAACTTAWCSLSLSKPA